MTAGVARAHWPGLDGLRGIAALAVVVFHASLGPAVNGFVGVDVFFALSGFLITSLLIAERARNGRVDLLRFYARRALRLYPALLAASLMVGLALAFTGQLHEHLPALGAVLVYLSNWWIYTGNETPLLEHTWTLAIEEHFYLVWPVLFLGLSAGRAWVRVAAGTMALGVGVLLFTPWSEPIDPVRSSYLRGFPIIWGALLAFVLARVTTVRAARPLGMVAAVAALGLLVILTIPAKISEDVLTGADSLTGVLSTAVVAGIVAAPSSVVSRWLAWAPLVWAGRRSYGIYLYHFPIMSVLRHQIDVGPEALRVVVGMVVALVVAELSYRWLEKPFLRLKDRFRA